MNKNMILCQLFKKYFLLKGEKKGLFYSKWSKKKNKRLEEYTFVDTKILILSATLKKLLG